MALSSTWISDITNSTLNMSSSTFSFQDALSLSAREYYYDPPFLFDNGCLQEDESQNCTASCQDQNKIFGSLDTLHNCMVYPTIADLYARNNLSNFSLAEHHHIQKATMESDLYKNITTTIKTCLIDYCTITLKGSGCAQALKEYDVDSLKYSPSNITSTFYLYSQPPGGSGFDFCQYVPKSFNPDIGGIGVYVSYWIQTGFALLSFILVVWWNWAIYYFCFGALLLPRGYSKANKIAQRIRNNSRNKHLPSLTGALAEFQKAQCFFMLAINIAALVNRNSGGFQPSNLQQLYNTYILIKSISISGYLPVTFTLFTLHLVDVVSWYLLVLSIVTVLVSIATLFVLGNFSPSQDDLNYLSQQAMSGGPDSCGTKNLGVYCYTPVGGASDYDSTDPANGANSMLAFCLVVLIILVAYQYHAFKNPSTGQPRPWLSKIPNAFFRKHSLSLRKIQVGLALISIGLNSYVVDWYVNNNGYDYYYYYTSYDESRSSVGAPEFVIFASCWTLLFALYLLFTSDTVYTRTHRPLGRFFNQKIAFSVDVLSAVFWFAGFIALAVFYQSLGPCDYGASKACGTAISSILVGVCTWITFIATTVLTARHMLRTRNELSEKHINGKQYWILQRFNNHRLKRKLSEKVPSWKSLTRRVPLWKRLTEKIPSWEGTSRKMPSWTKHPLIIVKHTRLQQNTVSTFKAHTRRAYQDVKTHISTLDWPSTLASTALFSLYLIFFGLYIHWFKIYILDLEWFSHNGVDASSWSFGQIVAISVWAEPLCEYFHLELRGMTRGFEHRLWGYKLVRIKQPDAERGIVSDSTSYDRSPSPTASLNDQEPDEYGNLGVVESRDGEYSDQEKGNDRMFENAEPTERLVSESTSREKSGETEGPESAREWQIPETVLLRSNSISPF